MGLGNLVVRGGKRLAKEAGHVAGTDAIQGWATVIKDNSRGIKRYVKLQTGAATDEEMAELKGLFKDRLGEMTQGEYKEQMERWQIRSRWHYVFSLLLMCIAMALLILDAGGWPVMDTMALAAYNFSHGLRASYRYWQMQTRTFFTEGSFKDWWQQGVWLV